MVKMAYSDARKKNGDLSIGAAARQRVRLADAGSGHGARRDRLGRVPLHRPSGPELGLAHVRPGAGHGIALQQAGFMEATDPNLAAFKARGGKLLMYHGWADGGPAGPSRH